MDTRSLPRMSEKESIVFVSMSRVFTSSYGRINFSVGSNTVQRIPMVYEAVRTTEE